MPPIEPTDGPAVTLFEAVNHELRQSYVAATVRPLDETLIELQHRPPSQISGWKWEKGIVVTELARVLSAGDAVKFAATYAENLRIGGWTVIVGPLSEGAV